MRRCSPSIANTSVYSLQTQKGETHLFTKEQSVFKYRLITTDKVLFAPPHLSKAAAFDLAQEQTWIRFALFCSYSLLDSSLTRVYYWSDH